MSALEKGVRAGGPLLVAVIGSLIALFISHRMWDFHFGIPIAYTGDSLPHALAIRQVLDGGWFWTDPRLGAPFEQHFQDWPLPDLFMLILAKCMSPFTDNWVAVVNGIYLLTFPLVAITAWWALVRIGVSRWVASGLAILYSIANYHFVRGEQHLFLSGYFMIPISIWLSVQIISGGALFTRPNSGRLNWIATRTVLFCLLIPLTGIYYAAFTLLLLFSATAIRVLITRSARSIIPFVVMAGSILGVAFATTLPTILYHLRDGSNLEGSARATSDVEVYGLKLAQMLLPSADSRVGAFRDLTRNYLATFPLPGEGTSVTIGLIASVGVVWLLFTAVLSTVRPLPTDTRFLQLRRLSALSVTAFFIATVGGISTLISLLLTSQIRGWNRMSIVFAFMGLAAVGLLVDSVARGKNWQPVFRGLAGVALVVFGFFDQTNPALAPNYAAIDPQFTADQAYFKTIEASMPAQSSVFELPLMDFPEVPPLLKLEPYDLLKPYLHTTNLKFSYGGVKGRLESEWQTRLPAPTTADFPKEIVAAGFTGLYVARGGFEDNAVSVENNIKAVTGVSPFVSKDGTKAFFDLRAYAAALQASDVKELATDKSDLLGSVFVEQMTDYYPAETNAGQVSNWANGPTAKASIFNESDSAKTSRFRFNLHVANGQPAQFNITWPDGSKQTISSSGKDVTVDHVVSVPTHRHQLLISTTAQRIDPSIDNRNLYFSVGSLEVDPG